MKVKAIPYLILFMAILYIFFIPAEPQGVKIFFKIIPMLLIIYFAFFIKQTDNKQSTLLLIGLFFCMLGDGLLIWFVVGLTAFLIGHLFYTASFLTSWHFSWLRVSTALPIGLYSYIIAGELVKALQSSGQTSFIIPVIAYVCVISIMFWTAIMSGKIAAIFGSGLFVISDTILAWNKFVASLPFAGELIMITYYGAQFLIAYSLKKSESTDSKFSLTV